VAYDLAFAFRLGWTGSNAHTSGVRARRRQSRTRDFARIFREAARVGVAFAGFAPRDVSRYETVQSYF
jgi:hypothetical protein